VTEAVRARGLVKHYGHVKALDGVDVTVPTGSVLGLLGPNGAGKTTVVRILATLLTPDAGTAEVAGVDVLTDPQEVRRRIGLSGQYAAVDEYLTGFENLDMIGRLYHLGRKPSRERARAAGSVPAGGRRRPDGQDLLRRDATASGPCGRSGRRPAGALPGRADDRA
jgi:ABC-2 type transport system ATP-binding protein